MQQSERKPQQDQQQPQSQDELDTKESEIQHDYSPKTKRRKKDFHDLLRSLKTMDPKSQLRIWKQMISHQTLDLEQLRSLRAAIDQRFSPDIISNVPYEIALYIMSFLDAKDLCQAAQTCRSWRVVCEDNRLWREKCRERGLLNDEHTLDALFKKRISDSHTRQEKFVSEFVPASAVSSSEWKEAYMKHMSILRNWRFRKFKLKAPIIATHTPGPEPTDTPDQDQTQIQDPIQDQDQAQKQDQDNEELADNSYLMQLRCHDNQVITCLQYNPKTNIIVSGSDDHTLKVWSSETGRCLATLEGHTGGVWSSQLSPDNIVISGATDRTLRVWQAETGELIHTLYGHTSTVRCLALDGNQVVSGSRDTTIRLWDISNGCCIHVLVGHSAAVRCVEFKNGIIVSGAYDHLVMVWDAATGTCCHELECHISRIYSLQFDGKIIASGSLDTSICIWDAETGKLQHHLQGHLSLTSKLQLKGNLLVSANADSYCKIWDVNTGECLHTLGGDHKHNSAITSVYFDNRHVITSSDDGTVKLWDLKTGEFIRDLIVLPTAMNGGVVWRIRASYSKVICAVGSRNGLEDNRLLVLDFN